MKKALFLLSAFGILTATAQAQDLKIVSRLSDTTYVSTINVLGMGPKNSTITVQGKKYPIYSSGEWAAQLNLTNGDNPYTFEANGQSISGSIFKKDRPKVEPITTAVAKDIDITPGADMLVQKGDVINIKLHSAPKAEITWLGGEKIYPVDSMGTYQGSYTVKENDKAFDTPVVLKIKVGASSAEQTVKCNVKLLSDSMPIIGKTLPDAYLNYGLGSDRLGGTKINYLSEGVKLHIVGRVNNMFKVQLSKNTIAWIPKDYVEILPKGEFVPTSLSGSWSVIGKDGYDYVTIGLSERLPYTVTEDPDRARISIDIYGAACNTNWITQKNYSMVKNVSYTQIQDDVLRINIDLNDPQIWGYSVAYQGNSLVTKVKYRPASLKLKHLTIAVDAGHGNPWNGAQTTSGVKEQDLTYDMALHMKKVLESKGAKVILTRPTEEQQDMSERKRLAREGGADIFVSIHCNAGGSPFAAKGTSTYYRHLSHKQLSVDILNSILEMDVNNFGNIGNFNFSLNQPTEYINVLVETLFLSSPEDSSKILDKDFRDEMMERVVWGIEKFLSEVPNSDAKAPKPFKSR
ncbi:MAG: N-acetylmuramoyl-L-alanine amidase [Flavobacteriales bacterium]|nr:N-acetylmuramoyl-L-alanine amidase [Flavobacteriales bacterium]